MDRRAWLAGAVVVLLALLAGAGGGYVAASLHPAPGPAGPMGPPGLPGPRGLPGQAAPVSTDRGGICVLVDTQTNYSTIPPTTYVTDVRVSTPFGGSCFGRGTYVATG